VILGLLLAMASAQAPAPAATRLAVSDVAAERRAFAPQRGAGERAEWRYRTTAPAKVRASIYDARGYLVRTVQRVDELPAGDHRVAWDGSDDAQRLAPAGYYLLVIEAEKGGEKVVYDPTDATGGEIVQASAVGYDPRKGLVRYALTKPALVRIHLGLRNDGPLLKTLVDWVARAPGEHTEAWDGWDESRAIRFGTSPNLDIQVWAYELPVNAVVLENPSLGPPASASGAVPAASSASSSGAATPGSGGGRMDPFGETGAGSAVGPERSAFIDVSASTPMRARGETPPREMYNHWRHDRAQCHNPRAALRVPENARRDEKGAVLLDEALPIRLELPPAEASFLQEERFEVVVYLDGLFVFEEEQGYLPFTWTARPEVVPPGEHVVTLMIRGYEGHFGSASVRILRPKAAGDKAAARERR